VTRCLIDIEAGRHDLGGIRWCWLAFGSEGCLEQTLANDQDNGLIFETTEGVADDALRQRLLPFVRNANAALDACGFPLCKGDIMAGNPRWCLSLGEWRSQFSSWVQDSKPEALLNATIFFDLRALHGSENLVEALRGHLFELVRRNDRFLRLMAQQALDIRPPLGLLRDFVVQNDGNHAGTLDLKRRGSRLFVDAARVIGLAAAVTQANTEQRLRHGGARLNMTAAETDAMIEAFQFIQHLRLLGTEGVEPNRVDPDGLNEVDRRILKESFRQARKLQSRLAPALLRADVSVAATLDEWAGAYGIENASRHNAVADALVTAQLFQIVMARALLRGITTCGELISMERSLERLEGRLL